MTPNETAALWLLALLAVGFYCWQMYRLHRALSDEDHPYHEMAVDAVTDDFTDPFEWDRWR